MKKILSSLVVAGLLCTSLSAETYFDFEDDCDSKRLRPYIDLWYKNLFIKEHKVIELKDIQEEEIPRIFEYVKEEFKDIKYCTFVRTLDDMEKPKKAGFWLVKTGENPKVFNKDNLNIVKNKTLFIPFEGNGALDLRVDLNNGYTNHHKID